MHMLLRSVRICSAFPYLLALFGAYITAVDKLSILLLKPKVLPYFVGSARKRRQLMFCEVPRWQPFALFCTVHYILLYTFLTILCV